MAGNISNVVCYLCASAIEPDIRKYFIYRDGLTQICKPCSENRKYVVATRYNTRPLGYPKIQGGKQSSGKYEWSD